MKATIQSTGEAIKGKNIQEIRSQLNSMLRVDGPRGLTAITDSGTEIHVELYEGQDYVRRAAASLGRLGGKSTSDAKRKASAENGKRGGRPKKTKE
jgi:hypothetical protein